MERDQKSKVLEFEFLSYLLQSLDNERNRFRKKQQRIHYREVSLESYNVQGNSTSIDCKEHLPIEDLIFINDFINAVSTLSECEQKILIYRILYDFTFNNIASILGMKVGTVKTQYYKALKKVGVLYEQ